MKIVLDVNIYVSWTLFSKQESPLSKMAWFATLDQTTFVSIDLLIELRTVLSNNFKLTSSRIRDIENKFLSTTKLVFPLGDPPLLCRDPNDDSLLHLCTYVKADYLITGDKDLLVLDPFGSTRIVKPTQAAEMWGLN